MVDCAMVASTHRINRVGTRESERQERRKRREYELVDVETSLRLLRARLHSPFDMLTAMKAKARNLTTASTRGPKPIRF